MLQTAKTILTLFPLLIEAIFAIEKYIPKEKVGDIKLDVIKQVLILTNDAFTDLWPIFEKIIEVVVKAFNITGMFTKTQ
jgi:hypothetical protein